MMSARDNMSPAHLAHNQRLASVWLLMLRSRAWERSRAIGMLVIDPSR